MMRAVVAFFLLLTPSLCQDCSEYNNCGECTPHEQCGWCSASQKCLSGSDSGPLEGSCSGQFSWSFDSQECVDCVSLFACRDCTRHPDCIWCAEDQDQLLGGICHPAALDIVCDVRTQCRCEDYMGCHDCSEQEGCSWCGRDSICVDPNSLPPELEDCELAEECNCADLDGCFQCRSQPQCGFCSVDSQCYRLEDLAGGDVSVCTPARVCENKCGEKECGGDGCEGVCGICDTNQYCNDEGKCKKIPSGAANFIGGMVLGLALLVMVILVYTYYTKQQQFQNY
eukprot:Lithocolla_globosa_v1_NODE_3773_length_1584_cov_24.329627.p1 type:complete len:283 gc:universal NODE_3773_length_1584_cov_24.329627:1535-687(-)